MGLKAAEIAGCLADGTNAATPDKFPYRAFEEGMEVAAVCVCFNDNYDIRSFFDAHGVPSDDQTPILTAQPGAEVCLLYFALESWGSTEFGTNPVKQEQEEKTAYGTLIGIRVRCQSGKGIGRFVDVYRIFVALT